MLPCWRWLWSWRRIWQLSGRPNGCAAAVAVFVAVVAGSGTSTGGGGERCPEDGGRRQATRSLLPMQSRRCWGTGSLGRMCGATGITLTPALGRSSRRRRCQRGSGSPRAADRRRRRIAKCSGLPRAADCQGRWGLTTTTAMTVTAMTATAVPKEHVHNKQMKWRNRKKRCVSCCHHHCHCLNHC